MVSELVLQNFLAFAWLDFVAARRTQKKLFPSSFLGELLQHQRREGKGFQDSSTIFPNLYLTNDRLLSPLTTNFVGSVMFMDLLINSFVTLSHGLAWRSCYTINKFKSLLDDIQISLAVSINNRGSGQVSISINSIEQVQIALISLIPLAKKFLGNSQPCSMYNDEN